MTKSSETPGSLESLWAVVPSVYYDLIARIMPGSVFLLALDSARGQLSSLTEGVRVLAVLAVGYIAGLLLTPFYEVIIAPAWLLFRVPYVRQVLGAQDDVKLPWNANDVIGFLRPEMGATLAKMQAESVLCANLATGFGILWLLPVQSYLTPYKAPGCYVLLGFLFLIFAANYRYGLWSGRQILAYLHLVDTGSRTAEARVEQPA